MTRKPRTHTTTTMESQIRHVVDHGDDLSLARTRRATRQIPSRARFVVPSPAQYGRRELDIAHRRLEKIREAPLVDRKEAQARFLAVMREMPEVVAERVDWMIDGSYGEGEMMLARRVLANPRMNRAAALTQMIGALEWLSPEDMSRAAWNLLSATQKAALDKAIQGVIRQAEATVASEE